MAKISKTIQNYEKECKGIKGNKKVKVDVFPMGILVISWQEETFFALVDTLNSTLLLNQGKVVQEGQTNVAVVKGGQYCGFYRIVLKFTCFTGNRK